MRQFTRHTTSSKHQHDDYWKLQSYSSLTAQQMRELLQRRGYPVGKSDSKEKLEEALLRSDCGMQSYADKSDDDLRALIISRGVDASHVIRGNKVGARGDLLSLLKNVDMDPKFERFSDLAPELRNKVYEHYFSEIRQSLYAPSEPPITRVSRDIRKETIKMYYNSCTFEVVLRLPRLKDRAPGLSPLQANARKLTIPSQMRLFMSSVAPSHMAYVRKLNIRLVPYHENDSYLKAENKAVSISIAEQGPKHVIESKQLRSILKNHGFVRGRGMSLRALSDGVAMRREAIALVRLRRVVRDVVGRDGKARLKLDDLYDIRAAMEAGL